MWYVGSPYTKHPHGIEAAFRDICEVTARLIEAKIPCYSPIAHCHPIALHGGLDPLDHSIWLPHNASMMALSKGLLVIEMEGWQDSKGLTFEIAQFKEWKRPIWHLHPPLSTYNLEALHTLLGDS